uniref:S-adenosylmethionine:tRNA ribosyltransferase-isomerase n=1 Tax=Magnetococcus massalia (strain MO-1) TaxID=451514 RepID=A0A1S7LMT6_MAGMO|nr:tRNA preQ1(34) S-adenosylmethionine ribosyltransferase-isomerase QueA [Candidatus Magnetococcus massalia]CRH08242.1 S-adenosylmethionine:tRNA ribosyltransferase-isomerase [Candidatus Magnetococcus massalia]CRH08310.1 S-adenosylmethionine:tRNA ribosyltransferase-isomerase [Candidatus Magnetococcus massalia]
MFQSDQAGDHLEDWDFHLPEQLIAQRPVEPRDHSRLLVSLPDRIENHRFDALPSFLRPGDLLVLNDTRVIPARLLGRKPSGGRVEIFLLKPLPGDGALWRAMGRSSKPIKPGLQVLIGDGFHCEVVERLDEGQLSVRLVAEAGQTIEQALAQYGQMPLPPYITDSDAEEDKARYQTVFAKRDGAVAAPTAGLHFTPELLAQLEAMGVGTVHVTLHVGLGTFQPVRVSKLDEHTMHAEWREISEEAAERIRATRAAGGRVIAVGTTAVRSLESSVNEAGELIANMGETRLFIRPGYRFRVVDLMITNFHLPKSTLLMLVAAFAGKDRLARDYRYAMEQALRFFSYGDAQLIYPKSL